MRSGARATWEPRGILIAGRRAGGHGADRLHFWHFLGVKHGPFGDLVDEVGSDGLGQPENLSASGSEIGFIIG